MKLHRFTPHRRAPKVLIEHVKHDGIGTSGRGFTLHLGSVEDEQGNKGERYTLDMTRDEALYIARDMLRFLGETLLTEDRSYLHKQFRAPTMNEARLAAMLSCIDNYFAGGTEMYSLDRYQRDPMLP